MTDPPADDDWGLPPVPDGGGNRAVAAERSIGAAEVALRTGTWRADGDEIAAAELIVDRLRTIPTAKWAASDTHHLDHVLSHDLLHTIAYLVVAPRGRPLHLWETFETVRLLAQAAVEDAALAPDAWHWAGALAQLALTLSSHKS
ncbi:hypothetical protein [Frankia gtarii]|uniref:hypothetical protein n=1 Tax=Frankia gtarii TaxID=2950102 RepID=UPI0021C06DB3|nr:hypothetical protein [Frankia gtarii]